MYKIISQLDEGLQISRLGMLTSKESQAMTFETKGEAESYLLGNKMNLNTYAIMDIIEEGAI